MPVVAGPSHTVCPGARALAHQAAVHGLQHLQWLRTRQPQCPLQELGVSVGTCLLARTCPQPAATPLTAGLAGPKLLTLTLAWPTLTKAPPPYAAKPCPQLYPNPTPIPRYTYPTPPVTKPQRHHCLPGARLCPQALHHKSAQSLPSAKPPCCQNCPHSRDILVDVLCWLLEEAFEFITRPLQGPMAQSLKKPGVQAPPTPGLGRQGTQVSGLSSRTPQPENPVNPDYQTFLFPPTRPHSPP